MLVTRCALFQLSNLLSCIYLEHYYSHYIISGQKFRVYSPMILHQLIDDPASSYHEHINGLPLHFLFSVLVKCSGRCLASMEHIWVVNYELYMCCSLVELSFMRCLTRSQHRILMMYRTCFKIKLKVYSGTCICRSDHTVLTSPVSILHISCMYKYIVGYKYME